jgi:hypothetical protein
MEGLELLDNFLSKISKDGRVGIAHIGLYTCLFGFWRAKGCQNPLVTFGSKVMPVAKIGSSATYHKLIKELNDYGYIRYVRSFSNVEGSKFYLS